MADWKTIRQIERLEENKAFKEAADLCKKEGIFGRAKTNYMKNAECSYYWKDSYIKAYECAKADGCVEDIRNLIQEKTAELESKNEYQDAADLSNSIGNKIEAAQLYERATNGGRCNIWCLVDAAKIYAELGDKEKAAELYEKHPNFIKDAADIYEQIGNHTKAVSLYNKRIDEIIKDKRYVHSAIALAKEKNLDDRLDELTNKQIKKYLKQKRLDKIMELAVDADVYPLAGKAMYENLDEKEKLSVAFFALENRVDEIKRIACLDTNYRYTDHYSPYTDNFGEHDCTRVWQLDIQDRYMPAEKMLAAASYLLAHHYEDLSSKQKEKITENLKNITKYLSGDNIQIL